MAKGLLISWSIAIAFGAASARADPKGFKVEKSNLTSLSDGQFLAKGSRLKLPQGGQVTLFDQEKMETRICIGPYEGLIDDCVGERQCSWWRLWQCWESTVSVPAGNREHGTTPQTNK
jgi:hypothetical protein